MKPRNKIQPLPFVLPALFVYILTVIIPILWSMGYSLFSWNGIGDMKFIGLENYVRMFQDETFREAVVNNPQNISTFGNMCKQNCQDQSCT